MDFMQVIQDLWAQYSELIIGVISGFGFGSVGVLLGRLAGTVVAKRITRNLDSKKIVDGVSPAVVDGVSKALTGHMIDVDISGMLDAKLEQQLGQMVKNNQETREDVAEMKECVALMADAVSRSRLLTKEEQAKLAEGAGKLQGRIDRTLLPTTKITLQAVSVQPKAAETAEDTVTVSGKKQKKLKL